MASTVSSSSVSAAAAVVVSSGQEVFVKNAEGALTMSGVHQMGPNGPFKAVCQQLKTCNMDEILMVLPTFLNASASENPEERWKASSLLLALSENSKMQQALTNLLKKTDCSAYSSSAKKLNELCYLLKKADMHLECIEFLLGASRNPDVDLRAMACQQLCLWAQSTDLHVYFPQMQAAAMYCLNGDLNQSRDLAVVYFGTLFSNWYFMGTPVKDSELIAVIGQARAMLLSAEPDRMSDAKDFFLEFMTNATDSQFALLSEGTVGKWEEFSVGEYADTFKPLWEKYQAVRFMASSMPPSSASAVVVVAAAAEEDLVKSTEDALTMSGVPQMDADGPFVKVCLRLKTCNMDEILVLFPMIMQAHESEEPTVRMNAHTLLDALLGNNQFKDALQHLWNHTNCNSYFSSARIFEGFCHALKVAGMGWQRIESLQAASQKADVGLRTVACRLFCQNVCKETEDLIFMAAHYCRDNDGSKDLTVRYYSALFNDGYFQRKGVMSSDLSPVIHRAQAMLVSDEPTRMLPARKFFTNFITMATSEQFALLPGIIVEEWKKNATDPECEKDFKPLWEQYQKRTAEAVTSS